MANGFQNITLPSGTVINFQEMELPNGDTSFVVNNDGRPLVVAEINGVNVPFYISTGLGGKDGVATGQWYPIMGVGEESGWFNKGSQEQINNFYGNENLREVAEFLNRTAGDVRNDARIPNVPDPDLDFSVINRDLNPIDDLTISRDQFDTQFQGNLDIVNRGQSPTAPEPTPRQTVQGINPAISDPDMWQAAQIGNGQVITRISVRDLGREGAEALYNELKELGLNPIAHQSETLGPTIRLMGDDVDRLEQIQSDIARGVDPRLDTPNTAPPDIDTPERGIFGRASDWFKDIGSRSGFIAGIGLGTVATGLAIADGASAAEAGETFIESTVPYGETGLDIAGGDMEAAQRSATIETASNIASVGGAAAGAAIGTMIFPGVGTIIGGIIGGIGFGVGGSMVAEAVYDADTEQETPVAQKEPTPITEAGPQPILDAETSTIVLDLGADQEQDIGTPIEKAVQLSEFSTFDAYSGDQTLLEEAQQIGIDPHPDLLVTADNTNAQPGVDPSLQNLGLG